MASKELELWQQVQELADNRICFPREDLMPDKFRYQPVFRRGGKGPDVVWSHPGIC